MKHKLILVFAVLLLAGCGELTVTPGPTATPDPASSQIATEEAVDTATAVEPAAETDTPASVPSVPVTNEPTSARTTAAATLPTETPTSAPTQTSPPAMLLAAEPGTTVQLPPARLTGNVALEDALARRRSVREFDDQPLTLAEMGQLLWAAQGITDEAGHRTAPSAGSSYPLEMFVATDVGVWHYDPGAHQLIAVSKEDTRAKLYEASGEQESVRQAPVIFVLTAVYERTIKIFEKERGRRYVQLEAGHATQNLLLEATALGLGVVTVGAFDDGDVQKALDLPKDHEPLYLIPVGHAGIGGQ